jgi:hypothetical protein
MRRVSGPRRVRAALHPVAAEHEATQSVVAFGLPELEVRGSARPAAEVLGTLADVATY